ncbi:MAG: amidase [Candidatus Competibacterales bacterium]
MADTPEPLFLPVAELSRRLHAKTLSPVALAEAHLARIEDLDPTLHAYRLVTPERALAQARSAEIQLQAGLSLGPLHGIPYASKDLFDVAGLPTTAGSKTLEGNIARADCTVTRRLAQAGMVLLGKTHTVEFAFGSVGVNHPQGTPHNPWAQAPHAPGGSSSGSAVAVAAGLAPVATGSDTACSVRGPAALCGVVGLKTTVGRISRAGVFPLSPTLDSVGPLALTVEDAALIFDALQGIDLQDPSTCGIDPIDVLQGLDAGVRGLRLGLVEDPFFLDLDPEVDRAVRASLDVFKDLGARVESVAFPQAAAALDLPVFPSGVEGAALNAERLDRQLDLIDPVVKGRMLPNREALAVDYFTTLQTLQRLRRESAAAWVGVDALVVPTMPLPPLPLATVESDVETYLSYAKRYLRNCYVGNLLDWCGVSLPCGFTQQGLPVGLMVYARPFAEDMALRVARAFEAATPWHDRHPDLSWLEG